MINTSFYTGIATSIKFISGFVVNKIVAVFIGPSGIAIISQFQNFVSISTTLATGGVQQGVVKYIAEKKEDVSELAKILSTSLKITLLFCTSVGLFSIIFSKWLSNFLLNSYEFTYLFLLFGGTVVLFVLNNLLISILNGNGEIKRLVSVKISSNLFGLVITSASAYFFGIDGALIAIAISQSVIFFVSVLFVVKSDWFKKSLFVQKFDREYSKKLLKYSLMAASSMVLHPIVQIGIRNHIGDTLSFEEAGYWDALNKISTSYLGLITTTLSIYYLPRLSSLKKKVEIRKELFDGYKIIAPSIFVIIILVYFLRDYVVLILYSKDFLEMSHLFAPQLYGDFFKVLAFLMGYIMLAKAKTKLFIFVQVYTAVINYVLSVYLINLMGLEGVVYAHAIRLNLHFILFLFIFRNYWRK